MPIRNRVVDHIQLFKGQQSGAPPKAITAADSFLISNFILIQNSLKKINGAAVYAQLETQLSTEPIVWLSYYQRRVLAQKGNKIFRETGYQTKTFDVLTLGESNRVFSDKSRGITYLTNSVELKTISTGATKWINDWGLLPPLIAAQGSPNNGNLSTSNSTGALNNNGVYKWTFTLYDNNTGTESPALNARPGSTGFFILDPNNSSIYAPAFYTKTMGAAENTATWTFAEVNAFVSGANVSARATHFRVYRTVDSGPTFKLASNLVFGTTTVTNGTCLISDFVSQATTLIDNTADTALGVILDTVHGPPPSVTRMEEAFVKVQGGSLPTVGYSTYGHIRQFKDTFFGIGQTCPGIPGVGNGSDNFGAFNSLLSIHEAFLPDYVADTRNINDGDGQAATALAVLNGSTLLIFKERSTYYLIGTDVTNYAIRSLDQTRGCVHPSTVQECALGVFSLDSSGVILITGYGPAQALSNPAINDIIKTINFNAISTAYSGYDTFNEVYWVAVPTNGSNIPNQTLCYSVRSQGWSIQGGQEGRAIKFEYDTSGTQIALLGNSQQGLILDISNEQNVTFLNSPITAVYTSGPCYGGDPDVRKRAHFIYITAESTLDYTVDVDLIIDFGDKQSFSLANINSVSNSAVYASSLLDNGANVGIWDSSSWGSLKSVKQLKIPVYGVGYAFQVQIAHHDTSALKYGFRILAVELEMSIMGR